jgi:hypothetical protein
MRGCASISPGPGSDLRPWGGRLKATSSSPLAATRKEDPDSLFFNRRLSLEGDTELGLVVKNTLDALELPVLNLGRWRAR